MIRNLVTVCIVGLILIAGCSKKSEYQQLVDRELSRNVRNDSLFLGYYLGMPSPEFFTHSKELNGQKKVMQGSGSLSVRYDSVFGLGHPAHMNFYPKFYNDKIYKMEVVYSYDGWAPWNRNLWADSLQSKLLEKFRSEYEHSFLHIEHPEKGIPAYIMVDGNKRIAVFPKGNQQVAVNYVDLSVLNEMEKH